MLWLHYCIPEYLHQHTACWRNLELHQGSREFHKTYKFHPPVLRKCLRTGCNWILCRSEPGQMEQQHHQEYSHQRLNSLEMLHLVYLFVKTRMHSSRMPTARTLPYGGLPDRDPPGQRPPWTKIPPPRTERPPPVNRITDRCKTITYPQLRCRR